MTAPGIRSMKTFEFKKPHFCLPDGQDTTELRRTRGFPRRIPRQAMHKETPDKGPAFPFQFLSFHHQGSPLSAADAKGGEAIFGVPLLHLMKQGNENPRAGRADGMS